MSATSQVRPGGIPYGFDVPLDALDVSPLTRARHESKRRWADVHDRHVEASGSKPASVAPRTSPNVNHRTRWRQQIRDVIKERGRLELSWGRRVSLVPPSSSVITCGRHGARLAQGRAPPPASMTKMRRESTAKHASTLAD